MEFAERVLLFSASFSLPNRSRLLLSRSNLSSHHTLLALHDLFSDLSDQQSRQRPRLLMMSKRTRPPVPLWRGTMPTHAAKSLPDLNSRASPMAATIAVHVNSPTPHTKTPLATLVRPSISIKLTFNVIGSFSQLPNQFNFDCEALQSPSSEPYPDFEPLERVGKILDAPVTPRAVRQADHGEHSGLLKLIEHPHLAQKASGGVHAIFREPALLHVLPFDCRSHSLKLSVVRKSWAGQGRTTVEWYFLSTTRKHNGVHDTIGIVAPSV